MDKTRVALTAIICITIVLTSFSLGMAPNVGTNANTGFQMETVKTGDVTWACLKHNREYIGCSTVETANECFHRQDRLHRLAAR